MSGRYRRVFRSASCWKVWAVGGLIALTGCMPRDFGQAVAFQVRQNRTVDAKSQPVAGMPYLRVDDYLLDRLQAAGSDANPNSRARILELLDGCHKLALESSDNEIARLSDAAARDLWRHCFPGEPLPAKIQEEIRRRHAQSLADGYRKYKGRLSNLNSEDQVRAEAIDICQKARPSVKTQRGSGPLLEWAHRSQGAEVRRQPMGNTDIRVYEPGRTADDPVRSDFTDETTRTLLEKLAPVIAQEISRSARYAERIDQIGAVRLQGDPAHVEVSIDTSEPQVYAYVRRVVIHGHEYPQLVYCYWFPEHPPARRGDPEAGPIDGATLRVTLDGRDRPAVIEAVQNCGCHFRCFASRRLDAAAKAEFGSASDQDQSALTRPGGSMAAIFSEDLFDAPETGDPRPIVFSPAGSHVPVGVAFGATGLEGRKVLERKQYGLHPYELLENMPTDFGRASMFGADGLVHNAGRTEGWLLAGTGMLSAGQPRQRGTQLICWDKQSFDDPHLLEKVFRLPRDF